MAILPIRVFPDPILRRRAVKVKQVDDKLLQLGRDMLATMRNAAGIGLAAPQVGVLQRVVTIEVPERAPMLLVNPEVTRRQGRRKVQEGCLSVPGYVGIIERAVRVTARYLDRHGGQLQITAEELLAQAIEHEIDHLNGILFLDHLQAHQDLAKQAPATDGPHSHDVTYAVHIDHDSQPDDKDRSLIEVLHTVADYSNLHSDAPLDSLRYDLRDTKKPTAKKAATQQSAKEPD